MSIRRAFLSSTSHFVLNNRLKRMRARDYADVLAMVYRSLGLTHLDHLTK